MMTRWLVWGSQNLLENVEAYLVQESFHGFKPWSRFRGCCNGCLTRRMIQPSCFFSVLTCVLASKFWYHRCCWRMTVGWWFVRVYATQYIGDYHIYSPIYCGLSWIIKTHKLGTKFLTNQRVEVVEASQSRYLNQTHYSTIKKIKCLFKHPWAIAQVSFLKPQISRNSEHVLRCPRGVCLL